MKHHLKVSVPVVTYNHAAFIRRALDGVLAQETDFDDEVIVSEDCSTDGTREIVTEYAERLKHNSSSLKTQLEFPLDGRYRCFERNCLQTKHMPRERRGSKGVLR